MVGTMKNVMARRAGVMCLMGALLVLGGCHRKRKTTSAPKSTDYADKLKPIVESRQIKVMKWPNFADYEPLVQTFYDDRNYEVAWVEDDGSPSKQATAFIQLFQDAATKGLNPDDYDAGLWTARVQKLPQKNDDDVATFDAAMTVCVMRYISDLRIGRVNPTHFNFDINTADKKYDLPEFVSDNAVDADDVPKLIASVEPDSDQYRKLENALGHYLELAKKQAARPDLQQPLPPVDKPLTAGASYPAADALSARLRLEGDLPGPDPADALPPAPATPVKPASAPRKNAGQRLQAAIQAGRDRLTKGRPKSTATTSAAPQAAPPKPPSTVYTQELSDAVKHYESRHGMAADGKLSPAVVSSLNVPLTARIQQVDDSLERWRWLPNEYVNAPLMVNLPEFVLRGYTEQDGDKHHQDFTMKVVVGKVIGDHDTPVFTHEMKYLIFRPFWNVPISIIKKELTAHIEKSGVGYLASKNFETVNSTGEHVDATAAQVEHGQVVVREKPGPKNSLGLVKFMFPNEYDIYLHSTPQPELFERTKRDFSHGCVRVQKPDELAVWVLKQGEAPPGDWDLQKVQDAMNTGQDNHTVSLKKPLPIVIFYLTARVGDDGAVDFFDDLYGYDKQLNDVLAKGRPYPSQQQKVNPNAVATPGDTD
jgi:murein L,D-transpeptidase YcbB/YkuD